MLQWIIGLIFLATFPGLSAGVDPQEFSLEKIAEGHATCRLLEESGVFGKPALEIRPVPGDADVVIWEKGDSPDWSDARYLVLELFGRNDYSGMITIRFYRESGAREAGSLWLSSLMGILPCVRTKILFPLSHLDAQQIFIDRSPRQLKGTVSGNRMDAEEISKVVLHFGPVQEPYFTPAFELSSVSLSNFEPEPYPALQDPVVDRLGQWKMKEWDGKVKNEEELVAKNLALKDSVRQASCPDSWSRYGGWKEKKFSGTGFFRTHHDGSRWWLVDPEGYAFLSTGVDCIGPGSGGPVRGIEDLFEWLPGEGEKEFPALDPGNDRGRQMDFYEANMIRVYGDCWKEAWQEVTAGMMREFRINTVGNWSDLEFARAMKIPYVLPMRGFPSTETIVYRDFPDVFSREYRDNAAAFAAQLEVYKKDPYLIGYFLLNEPHWAFGYHNLAYEMFRTGQDSETKRAFIQWITDRYHHNIDSLNVAWQTDLEQFGQLSGMVLKSPPSTMAESDFKLFSEIMVKRYIDIPCDAVERVDNNHLNLGMRYAWISSDLLYKAGERFDVFSINGYANVPPPTEEISRRSGKPVIIGEFHHGAVDRGLPATGIRGVLNQEERALAFRTYMENGFARPELVGMHYFQWIDQPFSGRFDGENYNIGIVTITNLPYPELTRAMKITNERIYLVGSGKVSPFRSDITRIPPIHY